MNLIFIIFVIFSLFSPLYSVAKSSAKSLEKVSLQLQWLDQFQFAGYYLAKEKGFYQDVGLDVEIKEISPNIKPIDEVLNNRATFAIGRSSLIVNNSRGKPIVLLAAIFQSSPLVFLSKKSTNITSLKDFTGKRLMIADDVLETLPLFAMVNKLGAGAIKNSIQLKHSYHINDLINNKVDLISAYISNEPFILKQQGIEFNLFDPKDYGFDFYSDILFTSHNEVDNHKQRVINFRQASIKGWEYAFSHIDETVNLILAKYNSQYKSKQALLYEALVLKKLAYFKTKVIGNIDKNKIQKIYDLYAQLGVIKNKIDINSLVFYDSEANYQSFMKKIVFNDKLFWRTLVFLALFFYFLFYLYQGFKYKHLKKILEQKLALIKSEKKFKSIVETSLDWIWEMDQFAVYTYCSPAVEQIIGYKAEQVIGKTPFDFMPENESVRLQKLFQQLPEKKEHITHLESIKLHKNGFIVDLDTSIAPMLDDDDNLQGFCGTTRDVTLIKETQALKRKASLAESANKTKSEFLTNMSHELRTPLNAILGFSQLLELDADGFKKEQRADIQQILNAGNHLLTLINEILDLSKIESGKLDVWMRKVLVAEILQSCFSLLAPQIKSQQITIIDNLSSQGHCVHADPERLKQILLNLLSNAVKYNSKGGTITVDSELINETKKMPYLRIFITDTGAGLTEEEITKLFVAFERLDVKNNIEGTGIGLVISQKLAKLMGSDIGVISQAAKGCTFWLDIQLDELSHYE